MQNDTSRHEGYATDVITDFSLQWLEQRNKQQPFFMVIGHKASHREWIPDTKDLGEFDNVTFPLPPNFYDKYEGRRAAAEQDMTIDKTMRLKEDLKVDIDYEKNLMYRRIGPGQRPAFKAYYDKVSQEYEAIKNDPEKLLMWKYQRYMKDYLSTARSMDRNIERVLHYLDTSGLASNTIVIYTSDQGFYLGEHGWFDKRFMYEESLRTPLAIRYPKKIKPGTVVNDMVVNIDLTPTILQMASCDIPGDIQGAGMMPLLTKQPTAWRQAMYYHYYEYPEPHRAGPHIGVRTEQHKLILFYGPFVSWELYDLSSDIAEMNNLYGKPGNEKITAMLKQQLKQLAGQYEDTMAIELLKKEGL
jgi:arylsulfatase A-like enzyme